MQKEQPKEEMTEDITMIVEETLRDKEEMLKRIKGKQEENLIINTKRNIHKVLPMEKVAKSPKIMIEITEGIVKVILLIKSKLKLFKLLMKPFLEFLKRILKHMKVLRSLQNLENQKMMEMMLERKRRLMIFSSFKI